MEEEEKEDEKGRNWTNQRSRVRWRKEVRRKEKGKVWGKMREGGGKKKLKAMIERKVGEEEEEI